MYVVINGGGKVAEYLARVLLGKGHQVAVIELRRSVAEKLAGDLPGSALVIVGDGCDARFQEEAGIERADIFVATTGADEENLVSCELAKTFFSVPRVIARVNNPKNERIFHVSGVEAVASTTIISKMIEEEATFSQLRTLGVLRQGNLSIVEVDVPAASVPRDGVKVSDLKLPAGVVLAARMRGDDVEVVSGGTDVRPGDTLVAVVRSGMEAEFRRYLELA